MRLHKLLEGHGFNGRVFGVIQILLEICLSVDAVVLVEPTNKPASVSFETHTSTSHTGEKAKGDLQSQVGVNISRILIIDIVHLLI